MAVWAVGDVQGCYDEFRQLLDAIRFDANSDRLWLVGDLVNRGPDSVSVVRFVRSLGASAITVLGNHDLHLLALGLAWYLVVVSVAGALGRAWRRQRTVQALEASRKNPRTRERSRKNRNVYTHVTTR